MYHSSLCLEELYPAGRRRKEKRKKKRSRKKPRLDTMPQDFEMDQNQPTLQFLRSCFQLGIVQAQSHQGGPKNMEIDGDYIPGYMNI